MGRKMPGEIFRFLKYHASSGTAMSYSTHFKKFIVPTLTGILGRP